MEARNSAGAISAISFANKNAGRSNCVNHQPVEKHGRKERSVQQSFDWRSQNEACFCSLFYFSPPSLSLSLSVSERSFSRKVDSRLAKVAVSRWIICELNFLSVQVSEVSIDELLEHVASDNGGLEGVARIQKLKLYEFRWEGRGCYSLCEWLVLGKGRWVSKPRKRSE